MTFNIRVDILEHDPENNFTKRIHRLTQTIGKWQPTILCVQEPLTNQFQHWLSYLPSYYRSIGSPNSSSDFDFQVAILYNSQILKLLDQDYLWLSKTPRTVGSKDWNSHAVRTLNVARFHLISDESINLLVFNTHLDAKSEQARQEQAKIIRSTINEWQRKYPTDVVLLLGDFNSIPQQTTYNILTSSEFLYDTWTVCKTHSFTCTSNTFSSTFHGWLGSIINTYGLQLLQTLGYTYHSLGVILPHGFPRNISSFIDVLKKLIRYSRQINLSTMIDTWSSHRFHVDWILYQNSFDRTQRLQPKLISNRIWGSFSPPSCTEANVAAQTPIPVYEAMICLKNCTSSTYPSGGLSTAMTTTDCQTNVIIQSWAGERYDTLNLPLTTSIMIGYQSSAWMTGLYIRAASGAWSIVNRLNLGLRPDGYINTSPVTNTLPVVFYQRGVAVAHVVQMADNDATDILQCRWSDSNSGTNYNRIDECGCICSGLPAGTVLTASNCTLSFTLPTANIYYACALQIEDYYNTAATSPMSSVPIQFLFYVYVTSGSACAQRPQIIGARPNRACIGVPYGVQLNETVIVQTFCPGQTIVDFVTSSPYGMTHSAISNPSANTWVMTLTWTPVVGQSGPQGFCAGALDNSSLQSDSWCITYLVDYTSPDLIRPKLVQGSASPVGTVFQNQSMFLIQATSLVGRPTRNSTIIRFKDADTNATVLWYDAGYAPNIIYTGYTIVIITNYTWSPGKFYYITMDSGFASGSEFYHAESTPITDPSFWRFNIWNPAVSSTTTTTTTPFTTATMTTKPTSTTSINTLVSSVIFYSHLKYTSSD
ncbi:unnamed protein product [Adineta ricciae]|uniref:Endonuclease/exonuclease/phosphatase domain-containing protein n=1 Tax=Adineta ricciae TaxID=249248 RepID=A0A815NBL8_ADIRI|nr:unnamed protein product [Adineta ricciae]